MLRRSSLFLLRQSSRAPAIGEARAISLTRFKRRTLSTNNTNSANEDNIAEDVETETPQLLYLRDSEHNLLPRAAMGFSSLNTIYWTWYTLDFIPAINHSPIESLHVNPMIGWGALALGVAINGLAAFYPNSLVSKVEFRPGTKELMVYGHSLPFVGFSSQPRIYPLGEISLDPASSDIKKILQTYKGDIRKYTGHLPLLITDKTIPWLLEVRDGNEEIHNGEVLLQALLNNKRYFGIPRKHPNSKSNNKNLKDSKASKISLKRGNKKRRN